MRLITFFLGALLSLGTSLAQAQQSDALDRYVGEYEFGPNRVIVITREGSRLYAQNSGAPRVELSPVGPEEFKYSSINARVRFSADEKGAVTQLVFDSSGTELVARRARPNVEGEPKSKEVLARPAASTATLAQKQAIAVAPEVLQGYVGRYEVSKPKMLVAITLEQGRLYSQTTIGAQSTPKQEIFAESPKRFFYKGVPIEVTFVTDASGRARKAVFSSGGEDVVGIRVP